MIVVAVKEGENIERALKRFKRKFERTGAVKELRARKEFIKPSVLKPATAAVTDASGNIVTPEVAEVALNYGNFIQNTVDFIIIAFVIFLLIKGMNSLRKKEEPAPAAPAEDPADIALLKEIRDELKKRN